MKIKYSKKGFTLIELLIVIAIIAILSAIIIVSYANAQKKSRDNKRRADIQSIASALQIYHQENKAYWAVQGSGSGGTGIGYYMSNYSTATTTYLTIHDALEQKGYLNPAPVDPQYPKRANPCVVGSTCRQDYMVYVCSGANPPGVSVSGVLENPSDSEIAEARESCNGAGANSVVDRYGNSYAVTVH